MLEVKNIYKTFNPGTVNEKHALNGVSLKLKEGDFVTVIGSNGAGKTTTMHAISGLLKPASGSITLDGKDLIKTPSHKIVTDGLAQVPEGRRIFLNMSVKENLEMGAYTRTDKANIKNDLAKVYELFPRMKERINQISGTLSGGELQMLAMGRALMANPKLLLLDEPSMGLAPIFVDEIFNIVKTINETGTTILLVEQNAYKALSISNRAYILETGAIIKSGDAKQLINDPAVKEAYLGG